MNTKESQLIEWALKQQGKKYEWGRTDCVSLVRKGLNIFLNKDPFLNTPYWKNKQQARKIWIDLGGVCTAFKNLGATEIDANYIRTGDVGFLTILKDETFFLVIANRYLFSNEAGVKLRKIISWDKLNVKFYRFI